ncbi:hypothetical protein GCM10010260_77640 [Streptomyces filipinensis]|uniref:Uncharacterized protein n=1 Tax=Streptomyces filipinensis TaxID=66887 RepID=A0A918MG47_9ACTN|nr:hypothetical protein [Streptomyces filipinensis]GGV25784.1 hypothetical protein GCM10010260_77640 [Streptomyces filipinensis]
MRHRDDTHTRRTGSHPTATPGVVEDRDRAADVRASLRCAGVLLGLLLFVDGAAGSLTWWRGALWLTVALLLLLVLLPVRVSAGAGWLATRRLLRTRRVRTDLLVAVRPIDGVSQRLVLRDALGNRAEIDPEVLIRNPGLWYLLDEGARVSEAAGTLLCGTTALHRLARRIDRETALGVFRASGMK